MTWTKLSDDFADDTWTLSDAAFRLHVEALLWSNRKLLNCRIPKDDIRRFKAEIALPELLSCGWWKDAGDHFQLVHHATYQRDKDDVINQQVANRANRAKRGLRTPPARELVGSTNGPTSRTAKGTGQDRTAVTEPITYSPTWKVAVIPGADVREDGVA